MNFNKDEKDFIITAVDCLNRQKGIAVAQMALIVLSKLQEQPGNGAKPVEETTEEDKK